MFYQCMLKLNMICLILIGLAEVIPGHIFVKEDDALGKIVKTLNTVSKSECLLRCKNLQFYASFNENICSCISLTDDVLTGSKYSIYRPSGSSIYSK